MRMAPLAVMGVLSLWACADGRSPNADVVIDTIGQTLHVRNTSDGVWEEGESWRLREVWRLGGLDAPETEQFTDARQVLSLGPNGSLFALDQGASLVRVFSGDGEFIRSFGRPGRGPADLSAAFAIAWGPDDHLWIAEGFSGQYTVFDSAGAFVDTGIRPFRVILGGEGRLEVTDDGHVLEFQRYEEGLGVIEVDPEAGEVVGAMASLETPPLPRGLPSFFRPEGDEAAREFSRAFTSRLRWTWQPDGTVWSTETGSPILRQTGPGGDTRRIVEIPHRMREFTASERDMIDRAQRQYSIPDEDVSLPTVTRLIHLGDGHLLAQVAGEMNQVTTLIDVFDPEGRYLGTIDAPFAMDPRGIPAIRGDTIVAVALEDLDVPVLIRALIERPSAF